MKNGIGSPSANVAPTNNGPAPRKGKVGRPRRSRDWQIIAEETYQLQQQQQLPPFQQYRLQWARWPAAVETEANLSTASPSPPMLLSRPQPPSSCSSSSSSSFYYYFDWLAAAFLLCRYFSQINLWKSL